eukprot:362561-Pyramimonas_sp.AAC.1
MRCMLARHGGRCTFWTPEGVRRGCGLNPLQARKARQVWRFLEAMHTCIRLPRHCGRGMSSKR